MIGFVFFLYNDEERELYLKLIDENLRRECKFLENKEIFMELLRDRGLIW